MARVLYLETAEGYGATQSLLVALKGGLGAWHRCTVGFYHDLAERQAFRASGIQVERVQSGVASSGLAQLATRAGRFKHHIEQVFGPGRVSVLLEGLLRSPEFTLRVLPLASAAARIMSENQTELVHLNNAPYANLDGMLAASWMRIPCVCHLRAIRPPSGLEVHLASRLVSRFIAVSGAVKQWYAERGLPADRITVIRNARESLDIDPAAAAQERSSQGISQEQVVFVYAGRLIERKGIDVLLEATKTLAERRKDFCVWVLGAGDGTRDWGNEAQRLGVQGVTRFLGYRNDVPLVFSAADVVVVPSTCADAFPGVVLEAMSVRRPVIASRIGGIPEAVVDGTTGVLVEPGAALDLATEMERLMDAPEVRSRMGANALNHLHDHFSPARCASSIDEVYRTVLAARS